MERHKFFLTIGLLYNAKEMFLQECEDLVTTHFLIEFEIFVPNSRVRTQVLPYLVASSLLITVLLPLGLAPSIGTIETGGEVLIFRDIKNAISCILFGNYKAAKSIQNCFAKMEMEAKNDNNIEGSLIIAKPNYKASLFLGIHAYHFFCKSSFLVSQLNIHTPRRANEQLKEKNRVMVR